MSTLPMKRSDSAINETSQTSSGVRYAAQRVARDVVSATSAAVLVSPIVAMIDKSIIEKTCLGRPLSQSLKSSIVGILQRPGILLTKPYMLLTTLYFSTFLTANLIDTVSEETNQDAVTQGAARFAGVSAVNISLGIYKDTQLAKIFGGGSASAIAKAVPKSSIILFTLRDCVTIFGSFTLPPIAAAGMPNNISPKNRETTMQLMIPAFIQFFSTPVHLLGLDFYGRQERSVGWASRAASVRNSYLVSCAARICRIVPAFGIGGVVNTRTRAHLSHGY